MSLITDSKLLQRYDNVQAHIGTDIWPAIIFWYKLLSKHVFSTADHVVELGYKSRCPDIVIKHTDQHKEAVLFYVIKPPINDNAVPSQSDIQLADSDAMQVCKDYLAEDHCRLRFVYAMTAFGTRARLWRFEGHSHLSTGLIPLFDSDWDNLTGHIDAQSDNAYKLTSAFKEMLDNHLQSLHPLFWGLVGQPSALSSWNEVHLQAYISHDGKFFHSWEMPSIYLLGTELFYCHHPPPISDILKVKESYITNWTDSPRWRKSTDDKKNPCYLNDDAKRWSRTCEFVADARLPWSEEWSAPNVIDEGEDQTISATKKTVGLFEEKLDARM